MFKSETLNIDPLNRSIVQFTEQQHVNNAKTRIYRRALQQQKRARNQGAEIEMPHALQKQRLPFQLGLVVTRVVFPRCSKRSCTRRAALANDQSNIDRAQDNEPRGTLRFKRLRE